MNALELQVKDLRDGFHEQGLRETGRTRDQAMTAGKQRDHDLLNDVALADDYFPQFGFDARPSRNEPLGRVAFSRERVKGGSGNRFRRSRGRQYRGSEMAHSEKR